MGARPMGNEELVQIRFIEIDNGAVAQDIAIFKDNGDEVLTVKDGGSLEIGASVAGLINHRGLEVDVATKDFTLAAQNAFQSASGLTNPDGGDLRFLAGTANLLDTAAGNGGNIAFMPGKRGLFGDGALLFYSNKNDQTFYGSFRYENASTDWFHDLSFQGSSGATRAESIGYSSSGTYYKSFRALNVANSVNYLQATGAGAGVSPDLSAQGAGADLNVKLTPKGTGVVAVSSGGITLSGGTALNTYVEDTFTPTVTLVGGAGNTVPVYATNVGIYTRTGNIVHVSVTLKSDGGAEGAGSGQINIALPITSASSVTDFFTCIGVLNNNTSYIPIYGSIGSSATTVTFYEITALGAIAEIPGTYQNNTTRSIKLDFSYQV